MTDAAHKWMERDPDPQTREELKTLLDANDSKTIEERFAGRLAFGTAGLRGLMGAGPNRMNRLVIRETTAGLANYLLEHVPAAPERGVVIGYDGRHNSHVFARDTACVLSAFGIQVHLSNTPLPTPVCAYALRRFGAAAAVVVTASHNPPAYNGYKVYWGNGAQIIPPHDAGIASAIEEAAQKDIPWMNFLDAKRMGIIAYFGPKVVHSYLSEVIQLTAVPLSPSVSSMKIVYTPLHGVGAEIAERALRMAGFTNVETVEAQREPDGDFPTVAFPNPEEPGAMDLVLELAQKTEADLAFANDPDADRLAVAARTHDGNYRMLTGNEIGVLLGAELINAYPSDGIVGASCVSSRLLGRIAEAHDVEYFETLTGFKWLANAAMEAEEQRNKKFLMAYEEALGYTIGNLVRDKDGISALVGFALLAARLRDQGVTVLDLLESFYRKYGLFLTTQKSIATNGDSKGPTIGARLRESPPTEIAGHKITAISDLKQGTRIELASSKVDPINLPSSDVLMFYLDDDSRIIVRPSGTEPKVKFYYEICESLREGESFIDAEARAQARLEDLVTKHQTEIQSYTGNPPRPNNLKPIASSTCRDSTL